MEKYSVIYVKKRNGEKSLFDSQKIKNAITKVFLTKNIFDDNLFLKLTNEVELNISEKFEKDNIPNVEEIQDIVELVLIKNGYHDIAHLYIRYREEHKKIREEKNIEEINFRKFKIKVDGEIVIFDSKKIENELLKLSFDLKKVNIKEIINDVYKNIYEGISLDELKKLTVNAIKQRIEKHYDYSYLSSRYLLNELYKDVISTELYNSDFDKKYKSNFEEYINKGIELELLNPELKSFDLKKISEALFPKRDLLFFYLGIQTIYDRYLLKTRNTPKKVFELPQYLWMRVAMGIALKEKDKTKWAIEFYNSLSEMNMLTSTPTLFNSGTTHSQMSSCYVNSVDDSLTNIFKTYSDCAQLSKWAGGIGTDWTNVRATGAKIKGTNGSSQGIIPFLKIYNDVALAVNQGGKRKGAMAAYLEVWHADIEEFLELKKNTGDERRRTHDMYPACFVPDLFMKRVIENGKWTLFSPDTVPGLHDSYGKEFEELYIKYENSAINTSKQVNAKDIWKKMLTMLYETGNPWITFKDALNVRNPQSHDGVIHSSNLCTEIALNTSSKETAVCNLASINLSKMIKSKKIDKELLEKTVSTTMRMLDNVIDNNFYPIIESENSNLRHRPVGLGIMGYQDALYQLGIDFDSEENVNFADLSMEMISYYAINASANLAHEKGKYETFDKSKWDNGIFPFDTLELLEENRKRPLIMNKNSVMDWNSLKEKVKKYGMRNSNTMAIAPTATISNIAGTTPCIEPTFKNLYMKENLSGNFILINKYLIDELENINLWNDNILTKIKLNNGSIQNIDDIPSDIKSRFKEAFEIDAIWILKSASSRSKWIDQSASTNLFIKTTNGKYLSDLYINAWDMGLKTTYYLRTQAASQITKTISEELLVKNVDEKKVETKINSVKEEAVIPEFKVCKLNNPDCESCQ